MAPGFHVLADASPLEVDRIPLMLVAIMFVVGAATLGVWIWALVDAIKVPDDATYRVGTKLLWVLLIVLTGALGAVVYLAIGRPSRRGARPRAEAFPPPPPPPSLAAGTPPGPEALH